MVAPFIPQQQCTEFIVMPTEPSTDMHLLLRAIADDRSDFDLRRCHDDVVRRALDVGFGPALYRVSRHGVRAAWQDALRAQDLAARVESLGRLDALEEILAAVPPELSANVTLLKGVSLCRRVYPEAHLRMMGDLDLLVAPESRAGLERVLPGLGYVQRSPQPPEFYVDHHHSMPFFHTRNGIVVEVHTGLFRPETRFADGELFGPEAIRRRSLVDDFRGFPVRRLDAETELAYIATHWINERRCFGTATIPILDLALLIRRLPDSFDWEALLARMADSPAAPYIRVALGFLHDRLGIHLATEIRRRLDRLTPPPRAVVDPLLHRMIDRHVMAGRSFGRFWTPSMANVAWSTLLAARPGWLNILSLPWRLAFPPGQARRYDPGFQLRRWRSAIRRHDDRESN